MGVGVALLLLAAYVIVRAARMPPGTVALPGPGFLPLVLAGLLAAVALSLVVRGVAAREPEAPPVVIGHHHGLAVLAGLVGVALLLERLGFMVALSLLLGMLFRRLSGRSWLRSLATALGTVALAAVVFGSLLGVRLPRGPW